VHTAVNAVVESWQLDPSSANRLIERTAEYLQYHQRRNAAARRSHIKATIRKLRRLRIECDNLKRCDLNTS
jgi:hypothetical protein